jgi:hypothetical protein
MIENDNSRCFELSFEQPLDFSRVTVSDLLVVCEYLVRLLVDMLDYLETCRIQRGKYLRASNPMY